MSASGNGRLTAADRLAARQRAVEEEEQREALRLLLMRPLLPAEGDSAEAFRLVRRHAGWLRRWLQRWPGWTLVIAADIARLRKYPSPRRDSTRGLIDKRGTDRSFFSRRRYALLCLVLATLENEQRQTTIQQVARKTELAVRVDPQWQELGFEYDSKTLAHRRELVAVMRFLQRVHVLIRADGDDAGYVQGDGDCLYRIERAALTTILCSVRGASTLNSTTVAEFIDELNEVAVPDSPDALNRELQNLLVRRLLDDPVMYYDELTPREFDYFQNQGERLLGELSRTTGMVVERRAEGVALLDASGGWTDVGLPETGTRGHATLLVAQWLGNRLRDSAEPTCPVPLDEVQQHVAGLAEAHQRHWRKNAATPEGSSQIAHEVLAVLESLGLLEIRRHQVTPRPAIARFRLATASDSESSCREETP